jgi:hypothetical protein
MDVLERLLFDLQSSITESDGNLEPSTLVSNIVAHASSNDLDDIDQQYVSNLLLQSKSPPSLLVFLKEASHSKDDKGIVMAKKEVLKFLAKYIKEMDSIVNFALDLYKTFYSSFKQEESNDVKKACLVTLKNIFRRCQQIQSVSDDKLSIQGDDLSAVLIPEKIKLSDMFQVILFKYGQQKIPKGLKNELLNLLGILIGAYSDNECVKKEINSIIDLCMNELKNTFSVNNQKPEMSIVPGALSCLDRCMFISEVNGRFLDNAVLWEYLLKATSIASANDATRFAISGKALRIIKHHAPMFQSLIGENAGVTYEVVNKSHQSGKKAILKHSEEALYAVLAQISSSASTKSYTSQEKKGGRIAVLQRLCIGYLDSLTSIGISSKEITVAVTGIAAIASSLSLLDLTASKAVQTQMKSDKITSTNGIMVIIHTLIRAAKEGTEDAEGFSHEEGVLSLDINTAGKVVTHDIQIRGYICICT